MAWTNSGYGLASWMPWVGNHTYHFAFGGYLKDLYFDPGGKLHKFSDIPNPLRDTGPPNVGNKI
jgi:hypothetical protein